MSTSYVKVRKELKEELWKILPSLHLSKKIQILDVIKTIWDKYLLEKSYIFGDSLITETNYKCWVYSNSSGTYFSEEMIKKIGNQKVAVQYSKKEKAHYVVIGRGEYIKDGKTSKGLKNPLNKSLVGSPVFREGRLCYQVL